MIGGEARDHGGQVLGHAMFQGRRIRVQDLGHPGDLGSGFGDAGAIVAGDQDVDVAADLGGCRHGVQGRGLDLRIVVLGDDEVAHQMTFASFRSLSTSSATDSTLTPPARLGGSVTFKVTRRGPTSTPRSAGDMVSIGFFFAFMMLGSEA